MLGFIPKSSFASNTGYFIVTAYYSPLPDQKYYITWNYESEKRLNGNGIAWASGKPVFSGMLAAPRKYWFGTKIQLDWLWIGAVEDRGWAIVPAWERWYGHDRIDVWVWYGDEWLRRAMYWGKRKIEWKVVSNVSATTLDYNSIPAPSWAVPKTTLLYWNKVQVFQEANTSTPEALGIFDLSLWKWSDATYVTQLQDILRELWYYAEEISTGEYDTHTIDAVYNFQINNEIVTNESTPGAGSYGPKTREKLSEIYDLFLQEKQELQEKNQAIEAYKLESQDLAKKIIEEIDVVAYGDISPDVRKLQKLLSETWHFDYKDTAIFWVKTRNALLDFQLEHEIISNVQDTGAGVFWPKTRELLSLKIWEQNFIQILELEGLLEIYKTTEDTNPQQVTLWEDEIDIVSENIIYSI